MPFQPLLLIFSLRDDAHQFELKLKKFAALLEHGIEVTMWQMNRNSEFGAKTQDDFALKETQVQLKLNKRGEFLVQSALTFSMKGGYLSKALNRRKGTLFLHSFTFFFNLNCPHSRQSTVNS
jgi:hypothetical protein